MYRPKLKGLGKRIEKFFKYLGYYLAVAGLVTFSLFIMEEAFQTVMFGTWPAQDAGDWILVKQDIEVMEAINANMKLVNAVAGWIQPLAFIAYGSYGKAADQYIKGVKAKTLAHHPDVFEGEIIEVTIIPKGWEEGWLTGGKIRVQGSPDDIGRRIRVKGVLKDGKVYPVDDSAADDEWLRDKSD